jgi:NADPH:quinone reductase-like Zn-dependent oxidoreductase
VLALEQGGEVGRRGAEPGGVFEVTQLAREAGAYVVGTGRAADPQTALDFGAQEFVDLENDVDRAH